MHRDISVSNLMFRRKGTDIYGVLNDFDLAVAVDHQEPSSKHRTGTKPFMAMDLLRPSPPGHLSRHDLESLFYALLWIAVGVDEVDRHALYSWANCGRQQLLAQKALFWNESLPAVTGRYAPLQIWLRPMFRAIGAGHTALAQSKIMETVLIDFKTLNGNVTFNIYEEIFDRPIPVD
jgi:hypothetical protein